MFINTSCGCVPVRYLIIHCPAAHEVAIRAISDISKPHSRSGKYLLWMGHFGTKSSSTRWSELYAASVGAEPSSRNAAVYG